MKYRVFLFLGIFGAAGCATSMPAPTELVSARSAYDRATRGPAASLALVDLHNARKDLDRAEASYLSEPDTDQTRDLSYIALRRAELAEARGAELQAQAQRRTTEEQAQQLQAQQLLNARSTVRTQQQQLANTNAQLNQTSTQLASSNAQLNQTADQLATAEAARVRAERETQAALASLRQISSVREEQRGMVITLSGEVLFATGQSVLLPIAQQRLDQVATALRDQGGRRLTVEGHTDSRGSASDNQALSLARAQAVRTYLVSRGIRQEMVEAVGIGPSRPVANNNSAEGRANNRRVEIIVAPGTQPHNNVATQ